MPFDNRNENIAEIEAHSIAAQEDKLRGDVWVAPTSAEEAANWAEYEADMQRQERDKQEALSQVLNTAYYLQSSDDVYEQIKGDGLLAAFRILRDLA